MKVTASTKYYVIAALEAGIAFLTYLAGQPQITEASLIGAALVVLPMIIHDLEVAPVDSATPPAK